MPSTSSRPHSTWFSTFAWWSVTVMIQGVIVVLSFAILAGPQFWIANTKPLEVVTCVLLVTAVLARTRWPWVFFGVSAAIYFAMTIIDPRPLPVAQYLFALICGLFALASRVPLRTALITSVSLSVVLVGTAAIVKDLYFPHVYPIFTLGAIAGAVIGGQFAYTRRSLTDSADRRARDAERTREALAAVRVAEQRLATARDLHDLVGHQVTVINLHAAAAARSLPPDADDARASLLAIESSAQEVFSQVRDLLRDLRSGAPREVAEQGGIDSLAPLVRELEAGGLHVEFSIDENVPILSDAVDYAVYRVLHEALVNAYKHGSLDAPTIVHVGWDGATVCLRVDNDIDDSGRPTQAMGYGLLGITERVETLGGSVWTQHDHDRFELNVRIPVETP